MTRPPRWLPLVLASLAVSGCGKVGALEQPAPLYGEKAKAEYRARKAAEAAAAQEKRDGGAIESAPADPNNHPP